MAKGDRMRNFQKKTNKKNLSIKQLKFCMAKGNVTIEIIVQEEVPATHRADERNYDLISKQPLQSIKKKIIGPVDKMKISICVKKRWIAE